MLRKPRGVSFWAALCGRTSTWSADATFVSCWGVVDIVVSLLGRGLLYGGINRVRPRFDNQGEHHEATVARSTRRCPVHRRRTGRRPGPGGQAPAVRDAQ